ncbi:MAG: HigA family addiction module antidote protein [Verrucomicrobia bacterium]|nr:HigA family addiction module antidote protein [Verrucomicrobiota bacterium]
MRTQKRKPSHPGLILDEHYIKPLDLNLQKLADDLGISRNTLYEIRMGNASVSALLAIRLGELFDTTPELWLNLQQKHDLWLAFHKKRPAIKALFSRRRKRAIKPFARTSRSRFSRV